MKCSECGAKLNDYETFWDCPECGYFKMIVKYAKLEEQNERFLKKFLGEDEAPEGRADCGNPAFQSHTLDNFPPPGSMPQGYR